MSIKLMSQVWDLDLPHNQLWVLMALADYADDDGYCWPSMTRLAHKTGYSDRQIRRVISDLKEHGIVEQEGRTGRSSRTWLRLDQAPRKVDVHPGHNVKGSKDNPGHFVRGTPDILSGDPGHSYVRHNHQRTSQSEPKSADAPKKQSDPLFEAIYETWTGKPWEPGTKLTPNQRGKLNDARKQAVAVGADTAVWRAKVAAYRRQHPTWDLTPHAVLNHWSSLDTSPSPERGSLGADAITGLEDEIHDEDVARLRSEILPQLRARREGGS